MTEKDTPFADKQITPKQKAPVRNLNYYLIGGGVAIVLILGGMFASKNFTGDRLRTLELIDSEELLDNHESLLGGRFRLIATVDAELGTEPGKGKLVAFRDVESQVILPALVTQNELADRTLSKGQRYKMEVEVNRGGLLHVNYLEKE